MINLEKNMIFFFAALLAGTLDAIAAILLGLSRGNKHPGRIFQFIASGVFGPSAMSGGNAMLGVGVLFHYLIAFSWVGVFFWSYPRIALLRSYPPLIAALFGLFIWLIMNLVVIPLSRTQPRPTSVSFMVINMVILMIAIGLPCVYLARYNFRIS